MKPVFYFKFYEWKYDRERKNLKKEFVRILNWLKFENFQAQFYQ